jgi:hypothetical protein
VIGLPHSGDCRRDEASHDERQGDVVPRRRDAAGALWRELPAACAMTARPVQLMATIRSHANRDVG